MLDVSEYFFLVFYFFKFFFFFFNFWLCCVFVATLGLSLVVAQAFSSCGKLGLLFAGVHRPLIAAASFVVDGSRAYGL